MKILPRLAALALFGIACLGTAAAEPVRVGDIAVDGAWSRATPPGARVGVGYLTILNEGTEADRLVSARSPRVPAVEIHSMSVAEGVMDMRPVDDGLDIPSGGRLELAPSGYHLMLSGLETPLAEGERVPVTLVLERAGDIEIELPVGSLGARGPVAADPLAGGPHDAPAGHGAHGGHGG